MRKNHIYIKHQAFNTAYEQVNKKSKKSDDGFDRPKKYHHAPEKLKDFTSYVGYFDWSNELYSASTKLTGLLRETYQSAEEENSSWYNSKNKLNNVLEEFDQLKSSLNNLYDDISEFQNCMLATDISEKQAQIDALSDQVTILGNLEHKIIETCNRKLYEISSARTTYTNLFIALVALFISMIPILRCLK